MSKTNGQRIDELTAKIEKLAGLVEVLVRREPAPKTGVTVGRRETPKRREG